MLPDKLIMKKLSLLVTLPILLFLIFSCSRESNKTNVYPIDGYFEAYFPEQPTLHIKYNNNDLSYNTIYNYYDDYEGIQYVALYCILNETPDDNKHFLSSWITTIAVSWGGNVMKYELIKHEGNDEILYVTESERNLQLVYEFGVAAIKENIVYQWAVEEKDDMSKADKIFGENLKYFKILK